MKKSSKGSKSQPFKKHESSAVGLIVALTVFNLVYSYAIGMPLPRAVVSSYVESVDALGDAQVRGYEAMGVAVVAVITTIGNIPAGFNTAAPVVAVDGESGELEEEYALLEEPEPLLSIAPNQISIAK